MQDSGASRRENAKVCQAVIARSACDEAIQLSLRRKMDCFAALAMTMRELPVASYNTFPAPGICRNARVRAQLNAIVSTSPTAALTIAGRS